MPGSSDRNEILFYEASEGGAGVLRQLVDDPGAIAALARRALTVCHFNPVTLEDELADACGKACYRCLLDYANQPDHQLLDRGLIRETLRELLGAETRPAGGIGTREEPLFALRNKCDSKLVQKFLAALPPLRPTPPGGRPPSVRASLIR